MSMKALTDICRQFRKEPTPAELVLWSRLRNKQIGYKFRRQHPIYPFVVDFYCSKVNLIVEVDGPIHINPDNQSKDKDREKILESTCNNILRVTNDDVLNNLEAVINLIKVTCDELSRN
jgi:very-short-patch-repair endonuclease